MPGRFGSTLSLVAVAFSIVGATSAFAATITAIPTTGTNPVANAINNNNVVVGSNHFSSGINQVYTYAANSSTYTPIPPVSSADASYYVAYGQSINSSNTIGGSYSASSTGYQSIAFTYAGSAATTFAPTGYHAGSAFINDSGTVVGSANQTVFVPTYTAYNYGYVMTAGGSPTLVGTLSGGTKSYLGAVNNSGLAVGIADNSSGASVLVSYDTTSPTAALSVVGAGTLGSTVASGTANVQQTVALNSNGVAAGTVQFATSLASSGFRETGGVFSALLTPTGTGNTTAFGIDAAGDVVGFGDSGTSTHAFIWYAGSTTAVDLNSLLPAGSNWVLSSATAINDNGYVVGTGSFNGVSEDFVLNLNAVPEPMSLGLMVPVAVMALRRRRGC